MDFRILGPLEVIEGNDTLPLGPPKQRALLAFLLLNANHAVSLERLLIELCSLLVIGGLMGVDL